MKWTEDQIKELTKLCYAGTGNAELARRFGVPVTEIYAKRGALGITIPKCAAGKLTGTKSRTKVLEEIERVKKARHDAEHKIDRCNARIAKLEDELDELDAVKEDKPCT